MSKSPEFESPIKINFPIEENASPIRPERLFPHQRVEHEKLFIGISGLIAAGKTTLADALAKEMNLPVYYEPVIDNVYLADFYKDPQKYGFALQIYLLNRRFKQHQQIIWSDAGGVQDRTIYEDSVFAKMLYDDGLMEKRDYETYISLYENMSRFMKKNNVIVHLEVDPQEAFRRLKMRNRDCESGVPLEYLIKLDKAYRDFIDDISRVIPVIRVNWNKFQSTEQMAQMIIKTLKRMRNTVYVDFKDTNEQE